MPFNLKGHERQLCDISNFISNVKLTWEAKIENFGDVDEAGAQYETQWRPLVQFVPSYPVDVKYLFVFPESQKFSLNIFGVILEWKIVIS